VLSGYVQVVGAASRKPRALTRAEQVAAVMASRWVKAADKAKVIKSLDTSPSAAGYVFALYARQKGML